MNITPLEKLREALRKMESKKVERDESIYPYWNLKEGEHCMIRFLPDADETNCFFWREKQFIRLPFRGTTEEPSRRVVVQVPCIDMYGKRRCPIMEEISPWFRDPNKEELARVYWKKKSYIFQGFIVVDPLNERVENPIRKLYISTSIFKIIKSSLMDPDIEDTPIDFEKGRDFKLEKTRKGGYPDYSTSKWAMKTRALTPFELEAIETFGLNKLSDLLPKEPSDKEVEIIYEMFQASLNNELYDYSKWGNYYKPNYYNYEDDLSDLLKDEITQKNTMKTGSSNNNVFVANASSSSDTHSQEDESEEKNEMVNSLLEKIREVRNKSTTTMSTSSVSSSETNTSQKKTDALSILESLKRSKK